jgi:SAM-dependent methyltransferase
MRKTIGNIIKKFFNDKQIVRFKESIIWRIYHKLIFYGLKYKCPICNNTFRKMLPGGYKYPVLKEKEVIGGEFDKNLICPYCGSFGRDRSVYLYLKYKSDIFQKNYKLLHVAPERSLQNIFFKYPNIDYTAIGLDTTLVTIEMDVTNLQFENEIFDVIICNHVLEHIQNDSKAMSEIFRVLKFSGWAILQVPISYIIPHTHENPSIAAQEDRIREFGQKDHVRIYGNDYFDRLKSAGFVTEKYSLFKEFGDKFITYHSLNKNELIFICRKN